MMKIQNNHNTCAHGSAGVLSQSEAQKSAKVAFSSVIAEAKKTREGAGASPNQARPAAATEGLVVAGRYYTAEEVKDFYASGGDDYAFARSVGLRDQNFIHGLALHARAMGGGPTGEQALKVMFKQYQSSTPNGASANDYEAWKEHQGPALLERIRAGSYVGAAIDPVDFAVGGIFSGQNALFRQNGLNPDGTSDKWIANVGFAETAPAPRIWFNSTSTKAQT